MKQFLINMHSGSDEVSSKRVYNSFFVIQILVMINGAQFFDRPLDFAVLSSLLLIVTGLSVMNLKAQTDALKAKRDVSSDMVKETGDNESAANVLQSDKPNP